MREIFLFLGFLAWSWVMVAQIPAKDTVRPVASSEQRSAQRSKVNMTSANPANEPKAIHTVRGKISADQPGFGKAVERGTNGLNDVDDLPEDPAKLPVKSK